MVQKALLFSDLDIAEATVAIESTGRGAMAQVKALGRKVTGFDEKIWKAEREKIVLQGNLHKFRQNEELKQKLLDTGDKVLVEASPGDSIWGIGESITIGEPTTPVNFVLLGYSEQKALENRDSWGLNLLGKALVETRRILREEMVNGT